MKFEQQYEIKNVFNIAVKPKFHNKQNIASTPYPSTLICICHLQNKKKPSWLNFLKTELWNIFSMLFKNVWMFQI